MTAAQWLGRLWLGLAILGVYIVLSGAVASWVLTRIKRRGQR